MNQQADLASVDDRVAREKQAYDAVAGARRQQGNRLMWYVYKSPNSARHKELFHSFLQQAAGGRRILEIGCGEGFQCQRCVEWGATEVHGIDLSSHELEIARQRETPALKFFEHDIHQSWPHAYDTIVGRGVLHHVDYRSVLQQLYEHNLRPGGQMMFWEPLGDGLLMRLYWFFGRHLHTPDERPFRGADLTWMKTRFPTFEIFPMNYVSLPASFASWALKLAPDNALTRWADRVDTHLASRAPWLARRYRSAIFQITKPR